jgi:hypothetical protein
VLEQGPIGLISVSSADSCGSILLVFPVACLFCRGIKSWLGAEFGAFGLIIVILVLFLRGRTIWPALGASQSVKDRAREGMSSNI